MVSYRILTLFLVLVAVSYIEGRAHKRRRLANEGDEVTLVPVKGLRFGSLGPPSSGGSPVCIIARQKRSLGLQDDDEVEARQTNHRFVFPGKPPPRPPARPPVTTPPTPPTSLSPTTPSATPPTTPTPPGAAGNINCIIVEKSSLSGSLHRSPQGETVTGLRSSLTLRNRRRQSLRRRKQFKELS